MYKQGERVQYKDSKEVYIVYEVYNKNYVSLALKDYPDIEQDYQIHIKNIKKVGIYA